MQRRTTRDFNPNWSINLWVIELNKNKSNFPHRNRLTWTTWSCIMIIIHWVCQLRIFKNLKFTLIVQWQHINGKSLLTGMWRVGWVRKFLTFRFFARRINICSMLNKIAIRGSIISLAARTKSNLKLKGIRNHWITRRI